MARRLSEGPLQLILPGTRFDRTRKGGSGQIKSARYRYWYGSGGRVRYFKTRDARLALNKKYRDKVRAEVILGYGSRCACCGETQVEFLALDHVWGKPEKGYKRAGTGLYKLARDAGFPATYRLLCHNCNCARGHYGYCPHESRLISNG